MSVHTLYRAAVATAVLRFVAGCGSAPGHHASNTAGSGAACVQGGQVSGGAGAACATVQVRAAE